MTLEPTMMRFPSSLSCVLALAALACNRDATFTEPTPPLAAIHWVHAVPDTGEEDYRIVDMPSNAGLYDANYRGMNRFYQGVEAGPRHIRIFNSSPDQAVARQMLTELTFDFTATQSYTLIHMGFARTGQTPARTVRVVSDDAADPGAGNVGFRVIHAAAGVGNIDVNLIRHRADTLTLPATPLVGNVAYDGVGAYVVIAADVAAADSLRVVVTAAGTTTPILTNVAVLPGEAGNASKNPVAGARVPGSVMTAVVVAPSVAGNATNRARPPVFTTASAVILVDRRPPDTVR
jgi:hypothetical protein